MVDDAGVAIAAYEYDPFGNIVSQSGSEANLQHRLKLKGWKMLLNKKVFAGLAFISFAFIGVWYLLYYINPISINMYELENGAYMNLALSRYYDDGFSTDFWFGLPNPYREGPSIAPIGVLVIKNNSFADIEIPNINNPEWRLCISDIKTHNKEYHNLIPMFNHARYKRTILLKKRKSIAIAIAVPRVFPANFAFYSGFSENVEAYVEFETHTRRVKSTIIPCIDLQRAADRHDSKSPL